MAQQRVDIFTAAMRAEFLNIYSAVAEPAPWERVVQVIPSTTKIENYSHLYPAPGVSEFTGRRRLVRIGETSYKIENKVYDAGFSVLQDDLDDDQVGGYAAKAQELAQKVKLFPGKAAFIKLRQGGSTACFDGTSFLASSHTIGSGNNTMTYNCASDDSTTHYLYACYIGGPIKPLFWQERQKADLFNNAGSSEAKKARQVDYWGDIRGAAGYGYWWDVIRMTITDTPTVAELQTMLGNISARFRGFTLKAATPDEQPEYVHEQHEFNKNTMHLLCSTGIEHIVRQTMTMDYVNNASNPYQNFAGYTCSGLLDNTN